MVRSSISPARAEQIADLAEAIADYHFPNKWIDPETVIREIPLTLTFNHYGDTFDGMLEWRKQGFHVYCNLARVKNSTSNRARFTLAHELGHYFIDSHRNALQSGRVPAHPSFCSDANPELTVEQEANHFASHLLMPHDRVLKRIDFGRKLFSIADIDSLKNCFLVSFQSAAIRLIESAGHSACAAIMWRADGKNWPVISPAFRNNCYLKMRRTLADLPPDSATRICDSGMEDGPLVRASTAYYWFYGVTKGGARDVILREEAVRLGHHGVFSLVTVSP